MSRGADPGAAQRRWRSRHRGAVRAGQPRTGRGVHRPAGRPAPRFAALGVFHRAVVEHHAGGPIVAVGGRRRLGAKHRLALPVRQISVVSVSPGNTGEVNREAIEVMLAATPRRARPPARDPTPVGAQPVQDRQGTRPARGRTTGRCAAGCGHRRAGRSAPGLRGWAARSARRARGPGTPARPAADPASPNPPSPRMTSVVSVSAISCPESGSVPRPRSTRIAFLPSPLSWMSATSETTESLPRAATGRAAGCSAIRVTAWPS